MIESNIYMEFNSNMQLESDSGIHSPESVILLVLSILNRGGPEIRLFSLPGVWPVIRLISGWPDTGYPAGNFAFYLENVDPSFLILKKINLFIIRLIIWPDIQYLLFF